MTTVTCITTCKGRLEHLRQSLPRLMALKGAEVIVVDYDCPQGTAAWVAEAHPRAQVVKVEDRPIFNLSKARNLGAAAATTPWLLFIDADALADPALLEQVTPLMAADVHLVPDPRPWWLWGNLFVPRERYLRVGGYDETFEGWGAEDQDFTDRLALSGCPARIFPGDLLSSLWHDHDLRTQFHATQDVSLNASINALYAQVKLDLMRQRIELTPEGLAGLYADVGRAARQAGRAAPIRLTVTFRDELTGLRRLVSRLSYEMPPLDEAAP